MVGKRDFDKILVDLLRKNNNLVNVAVIDAEGIVISFAIRSRQYHIKPDTLGSKTKFLLFLSKQFAKSIQIQNPIVQVYVYDKVVVFIINLKVINVFLISELKGGKLNCENIRDFLEDIKGLLSQIEKHENSTIKELFEEEEDKNIFKISDLSYNSFKIIENGLDLINQIQINPIEATIESISLDQSYYSNYLKENVLDFNGVIFSGDGTSLFESEHLHHNFRIGIEKLYNESFNELQPFNLGIPIWSFNIYEDNKILLLNKLGTIKDNDIYSSFIIGNQLESFNQALNNIYKVSVNTLNSQKNDNLTQLVLSLELLGFSIENFDIKIEFLLKKAHIEAAKIFLERGANILLFKRKYSDAGKFINRLGDLHIKVMSYKQAERLFLQAIDYFLRENNFESIGDISFKLGNIAKNAENFSQTLNYYKNALTYYKKARKFEKIEDLNESLNETKDFIGSQIKTFLDSATGEMHPFSYLEKRYNLSETGLVEVFKRLFEKNVIPGQIDLVKKRYTKKKIRIDTQIIGGLAPVIEELVISEDQVIREHSVADGLPAEPVLSELLELPKIERKNLIELFDSANQFQEVDLTSDKIPESQEPASKTPLSSLLFENLPADRLDLPIIDLPRFKVEPKEINKFLLKVDTIDEIKVEIKPRTLSLSAMLDMQDVDSKLGTYDGAIQDLFNKHKYGEISREEYYHQKAVLEDKERILKMKKDYLDS